MKIIKIGNYYEGLISFETDNHKWGLMNENSEVVVRPSYNGLKVLDNCWLSYNSPNNTLLNTSGVQISKNYFHISAVKGLKMVAKRSNILDILGYTHYYGYINSDGIEVIPPIYIDEPKKYGEVYVLTDKNKKYRYATKNKIYKEMDKYEIPNYGIVVLPSNDAIEAASGIKQVFNLITNKTMLDNYVIENAHVYYDEQLNKIFIVAEIMHEKKPNELGVFDADSNLLFSSSSLKKNHYYDTQISIEKLNYGLFKIVYRFKVTNNEYCNILNSNGEKVYNRFLKDCYCYKNGIIEMTDLSNKKIYLNLNGEIIQNSTNYERIVIDEESNTIYGFYNDENNNEIKVVLDNDFNEIFRLNKNYLSKNYYKDFMHIYYDEIDYTTNAPYKYVRHIIIDRKGNIILNYPNYFNNDICSIDILDDVFLLKRSRNEGYIVCSFEGEVLCNLSYPYVKYDKGYLIVSDNDGKYGLYHLGTKIFDLIFDSIRVLKSGIFCLEYNHQFFVFNDSVPSEICTYYDKNLYSEIEDNYLLNKVSERKLKL